MPAVSGPVLAVELAGHVALLLWGMRAVQRGVGRAFGSDLRRFLGRALRNRLVAVGAGVGVTMLLQSSTATAMMVTSFAARGAVDLIPAMAVMLGANVGTGLIVKALSSDVSWLSPLLMLVGYIAQKRAPKGRWRELGRVGIGLGLVLLALHLLVETMKPSGSSESPGAIINLLLHDPASRGLFVSLTSDPLVDLLLAAVLTFAAHSSIATILLLASVVGSTDLLSPVAAAAFVLGANVGGALPPLIETRGTNPANRRLPAGNLLVRATGCLVVLPFLGPITAFIWDREPNPGSAVITFHLAFNVVLAACSIGLLGPLRNLLTTLLPEKVKSGSEAARPAFLDPEAQDTPYLALTNAAREILRMGDLVDGLLRLMAGSMARPDNAMADQARVLGRELDMLHAAVKGYLSGLERSELTERDVTRLSDLLEFAINLGHAGDIVERRVVQACAGHEGAIDAADRDAAAAMHARVSADLRLAMSTMMTEDGRSARQLLDAKRAMNEEERVTTRAHLARLGRGDREALAASGSFLLTLRDLKLVNSHLSSIAYAVLTPSERQTPAASVTLERMNG